MKSSDIDQQAPGGLGESVRAKKERERKEHPPTVIELEAEWVQMEDRPRGIQINRRTGKMRNASSPTDPA